jgi:hypothetical protein
MNAATNFEGWRQQSDVLDNWEDNLNFLFWIMFFLVAHSAFAVGLVRALEPLQAHGSDAWCRQQNHAASLLASEDSVAASTNDQQVRRLPHWLKQVFSVALEIFP